MNNKIDYKQTIYSDGSKEFFMPEDASIGDDAGVTLRVYKKNDIKGIYLCIIPEGERIYISMKKNSTGGFFQRWKAEFKITTEFMNYKFFILTDDSSFWYSQVGITSYVPQDIYDFKYNASLKPVCWLKGRVFYQIFPDRFFDGDPGNNVKDNEYFYEGCPSQAMQWGKVPENYKSGTHLQFYGGDLAGIKKKLGYLKNLGVNALYLTPVFLSPSSHKYDVEDYYKIDPHFGTNEEFKELVFLLHKNNIKIILDGVFNHCGMSNLWFNKCKFYKEEGAYQSRQSPYYDYFRFRSHPEDYASWLGIKTLPKLNYQSEKLKDVIYKKKNSIAKFWLKPPYKCDGWRLDVANMLARDGSFQGYKEIYRDFRHEVKSASPESYIVGEHFFDPQELLKGDMLDAVMNYQGFYFPVVSWFSGEADFPLDHKTVKGVVNIPAQELEECLNIYLARFTWVIQHQMYNLLNSHDTPRFYSLINKNKKLLKGASIMLFTYPGIPSIFYGDEIGMEGATSLGARSCMIWKEDLQDREIFQMYKKLISLKRRCPALSSGGIKFLFAKDDIISFIRFNRKSFVLSVINRGEPKEVLIPLWKAGLINNTFTDIFSGGKFKVKKGRLNLKIKYQESLCLVN